jgi:hypothetical protein
LAIPYPVKDSHLLFFASFAWRTPKRVIRLDSAMSELRPLIHRERQQGGHRERSHLCQGETSGPWLNCAECITAPPPSRASLRPPQATGAEPGLHPALQRAVFRHAAPQGPPHCFPVRATGRYMSNRTLHADVPFALRIRDLMTQDLAGDRSLIRAQIHKVVDYYESYDAGPFPMTSICSPCCRRRRRAPRRTSSNGFGHPSSSHHRVF